MLLLRKLAEGGRREGKGMMHKSKTAKATEVVGEQNGVIHSALWARKLSKGTSKRW